MITEQEWLSAVDPLPMLAYCFGTRVDVYGRGMFRDAVSRPSWFTDRKRVLFACARARLVWDLLDDGQKEFVVFMERTGRIQGDFVASQEYYDLTLIANRRRYNPHVNSPVFALSIEERVSESGLRDWQMGEPKRDNVKQQCGLLRCLCGNPFRRTPFWEDDDILWEPSPLSVSGKRQWDASKWVVPAIVAFASQITGERDWDAMPILGDMLEDNGCACVDLLAHLRGLERCGGCLGSGKVFVASDTDAFAAGDVKCDGCNGTGWLRSGLHCLGCYALDLLTSS